MDATDVRAQVRTHPIVQVSALAHGALQPLLPPQIHRVQGVVDGQQSEMVGEKCWRREISDVDVDTWRQEARIVGRSQRHGDQLPVEHAPEFFGDVVFAQTVLEGEIEAVVAFQNVIAGLESFPSDVAI